MSAAFGHLPPEPTPVSSFSNSMVLSNNSSVHEELHAMSKEELISRYIELKVYADDLRCKSADERLRQFQAEAQRRENVLFMRLTAKEQEVQEFLSQLEELRTSLGGGLRNVLMDPVVNSMFEKMKEELHQTKEKLEQSQQELNAWKFTPDSNTGKRLMAKCRSLIQENEEFGRAIETGRLARLETQLNVATADRDTLKASQAEWEEFMLELDEDMEGLQSTLVCVQNQLEAVRGENRSLRQMLGMRPDAPLDSQDAAGQLTSAGTMSNNGYHAGNNKTADGRDGTPGLEEPPRQPTAARRHGADGSRSRPFYIPAGGADRTETAANKSSGRIFNGIGQSPERYEETNSSRSESTDGDGRRSSGPPAAHQPSSPAALEEETERDGGDRHQTAESAMDTDEAPPSPPARKMPRMHGMQPAEYSPKSPQSPDRHSQQLPSTTVTGELGNETTDARPAGHNGVGGAQRDRTQKPTHTADSQTDERSIFERLSASSLPNGIDPRPL